MPNKSKREERELLELECKLTRLKIDLERQKLRRSRRQEPDGPAAQVLDLVSNMPSQSLWKSVLLPIKWKHRAMLGAALMAFEFWKKKR
ncbi:hypothetical protein [Neisseria wadsworthii]|uniref:Uncharacterized protein n=1 Tax=Neisseria wadsworthii 9715 TaxID=1030841 RepID=G4CS78_9NEIS|nr:hypothetical protein [Neisseria wadsworthii]EGZ44861.1 hypothetical protein HMPREF9370_1938 [Neisseria wadsworthii 9715]QMT35583.1 hypothetical protein H3L96_11255 [Neisseria wadsworthii]